MTQDSHDVTRDRSNSRRDFLKRGGLGVALLGVGSAAGAAPSMTSRMTPTAAVDVVVVGAGFSGLSAARQLARVGKSVAVLEASDRVGGRTKSGQIAGQTVDLGGMWVASTQERILALGEEYGVKRYRTPIAGRNISDLNGAIRKGQRDLPAIDAAGVAELMRAAARLDEIAATVPLETPWTAPNAQALDHIALGAWVDETTNHAQARLLLNTLVAALSGGDGASLSLLFFASYIRSCGSFASVTSIDDGALQWLFHGGVHQIAGKMAAELGDRVVLNAPVSQIHQDGNGVEVTSSAGVWKAKQVIVAVPPTLCARIRFTPALPAARDALTQRFPMGSAIKFWVAYDRPFWRERGLNGYAFSDQSPVKLSLDATPEGAKVGLLTGFIEGAAAVEWGPKGAAARRALVLTELGHLYGPEGGQPIDYVDNDWCSEEWARGGSVGVPTPGTLSLFGSALRARVGRIHWAGAETSPRWTGHIDGAIRAGERAARDAFSSL